MVIGLVVIGAICYVSFSGPTATAPQDNNTPLDQTEHLKATDAERDQFLARINMYRCMHGVPPVVWNRKLYLNTKKVFGKATEMIHSGSYGNGNAEGGFSNKKL